MQPPSQDRFTGAAAARDHHPTQARIYRSQKEGQLEGAVASNGRQRKRARCHSACNHGSAQSPNCGRQSR